MQALPLLATLGGAVCELGAVFAVFRYVERPWQWRADVRAARAVWEYVAHMFFDTLPVRLWGCAGFDRYAWRILKWRRARGEYSEFDL